MLPLYLCNEFPEPTLVENQTKRSVIILLSAGMILLSACEQAEQVTLHEPGVYQGASDDLSTDAAALQDRLKNQMDR